MPVATARAKLFGSISERILSDTFGAYARNSQQQLEAAQLLPVMKAEKLNAVLTDMEIGIKSFLAAYISHTCKGVIGGSAAVANTAAFYYRKTCFLVNESSSYAVYHIINPYHIS